MNPVPPTHPAAPPAREDGAGPSSHARPLLYLALVAAVFAVLFAFVLWSRSQDRAALESETKENAVPTVSVVHPKRTPVRVDLELPGNVQAFEESPLYARVNGYLTNWLTDIGSRVVAGQLLAEIDTPELDQELNQGRAALLQAGANLEIAKVSAVRWQALLKSDAVARQDTDEKVATWHAREADVTAAEANVQRLREMTRFKKITAPFPGIITVRNVDVGNLIAAGASREIFRLARVDPLRVYVSLPQADSQTVKPGDEAALVFAELPGEKFTGRVVRTAGAIDPASRTLLTEVQVPNHDGRLLSGAHTMVRLTIASPGVPLTVPVNTLLFRNERGMQVGVVESNDVIRLADVQVGRDYGNTVEIVHGLSETDNIVVNPSDSLEAGMTVRVAPPAAKEAKPAAKEAKP